ncbi:unnamed protein product [Chrysoparadoxa australica]
MKLAKVFWWAAVGFQWLLPTASAQCASTRPERGGKSLAMKLQRSSSGWVTLSNADDGKINDSARNWTKSPKASETLDFKLLEGPFRLTGARIHEDNNGGMEVDSWTMNYWPPGGEKWQSLGGFVDSGCEGWNVMNFEKEVIAEAVRFYFRAKRAIEIQELDVFGTPYKGIACAALPICITWHEACVYLID